MTTSQNISPRATIRTSFSVQEHAELLRAAQAAYQTPAAFVNRAVAQYIDVRRSDRWEFDTEDWGAEIEFDLVNHPSAPDASIEVDFNSREMRQISAASEIASEPLYGFIDRAIRERISRAPGRREDAERGDEPNASPPVVLSVEFSSDDYRALHDAARLDGMQLTEFVQIAVGASMMTQRRRRLRASRIDEDWGPDPNHERGTTAFATVRVSRDGDQLDDLLAVARLADEDTISFIRSAVRERVVMLLTNAKSP